MASPRSLKKAEEEKENASKNEVPIENLPDDIQKHAASYLGNKDLASLGTTSKNQHRLFKPALEVRKLLDAAAKGDESKVRKILEGSPELLLKAGRVIDHSGRTIEGTVLQIALGAGDVEMCRMMLGYFDRLKNGREEAAKQMKAQFPESKEENILYDFQPLLDAISTYPDNREQIEEILKQFRADFTPREGAIITKGEHFDVRNLVRVLALHDQNYDAWSEGQRDLCWIKVIGFLQRQLPAWLAQRHAQGLSWGTEFGGGKPLPRSFHMPGGAIFPLDLSSQSGLGFDHAIHSAAFPLYVSKCNSMAAAGMIQPLEELCQAKTLFLGELKQELQNPRLLGEPKQELQNPRLPASGPRCCMIL